MSVSLSAPLFSFESTYMVVAGENARRSGGGGGAPGGDWGEE